MRKRIVGEKNKEEEKEEGDPPFGRSIENFQLVVISVDLFI